jgi:hypothetical protein
MRKICPQCQGNFDGQLLCPKCGIQLLNLPDRSAVISEVADQGFPVVGVGRQMLAGLILAQGLYYTLRQLGIAAEMVFDGSGRLPADSRNILAGLQICGVLLGGLVAGAGNSRAVFAGAAIGLLNAVALIGAQVALGNRPADFMLFGAWLPHMVFGAVGGWAGRHFWPSLLDLPDPARPKPEKTAKVEKPVAPGPPLSWLRVLGGAALSVGCTVWAGAIRDGFIHFASGTFVLESRLQGRFVAWAISALAMLVGGALAGASSRGGLRHGFLVGLLASASIFIIHQEVVKEVLPAETFFASVVGLPDEDTPTPAQTGLFLLTNTLLLGTLGGLVGGMLLPRLGESNRGALDRGAI